MNIPNVLNPNFLSTSEFVTGIKGIKYNSVAGKRFVTESLQTIQKGGLSFTNLNGILANAKDSVDHAVKDWHSKTEAIVKDNEAINKIGWAMESALTTSNSLGRSMAEKGFREIAELVTKDNDFVVESIAVSGTLDNQLHPTIKSAVNAIKKDYYSEADIEQVAQTGLSCSHPIGLLTDLPSGGIALYFDNLLLKIEGSEVSPLDPAALKVEHGFDISASISALDTLTPHFNKLNNTFEVSMAFGKVCLSNDGLTLDGKLITTEELFQKHELYCKLYTKSIESMNSAKRDDLFTMSLTNASDNFDKFVVIDNVFKCDAGFKTTQYLLLFNECYYVLNKYDYVNTRFELKKFSTLRVALDNIQSGELIDIINKKFATKLSDESSRISQTSDAISTYESMLSDIDNIIGDMRSKIVEAESKPFMSSTLEQLKSTLVSLESQRENINEQLSGLR